MNDLTSLADEVLVDMYSKGNEKAFDELLNRYQSKLYTYIYFIVSCAVGDVLDVKLEGGLREEEVDVLQIGLHIFVDRWLACGNSYHTYFVTNFLLLFL